MSVHHERLDQFRQRLSELNLTAFIVPKADEFQFEYVHTSRDRLAWLTGFNGSAGLAIVGHTRAGLFSDGRYTEQLRTQTTSPPWEYGDSSMDHHKEWLSSWIRAGEVVGYDPKLHTPASLQWLESIAKRRKIQLQPIEPNPIDALWNDRPAFPCSAIELYPEALAGKSSAAKRDAMASKLRDAGLDALVVSDSTNLAWLLNIRGRDLEHTPLALGAGILGMDGSMRIFMDPRRWTPTVQDALAHGTPGETTFEDIQQFSTALDEYAQKSVRIDRQSATSSIIRRLEAVGATVDVGDDPCTLAKACKTAEELAGMRAAHIRDGVAMVRFLHWLARETPGGHTEWTLVQKLAEFRELDERYRAPSFRTISAFGPSGASPHYTVTPESARTLEMDNLYLVDSGGQYLDGTTDITRVTCIGTPSAEMRRRYTQVLRGHVALARARFPRGVHGSHLDALARQFLWADGVDYAHGTGHGVGCYLCVHEGPQRISARPDGVALQPGMVLSNEPGYYKPGEFGIRIENLVEVIQVDPQPSGAEATTLGFENLTLCPYDPGLIELELLQAEERRWIDTYHARVRATLSPFLPPEDAAWLSTVTAPLGGPDSPPQQRGD